MFLHQFYFMSRSLRKRRSVWLCFVLLVSARIPISVLAEEHRTFHLDQANASVQAFPEDIVDSVTREFTVHVNQGDSLRDATSREFTVYSNEQVTPSGAIGREFTVFNDLANPPQFEDTLSREMSAFVVVPLELGVPYEGSLPVGPRVYFRLDPPPGLTVIVDLDHASDTAWTEFYANLGSVPLGTDWDFAATVAGQSDQKIVIPTTAQGSYYFLAQVTGDTNGSAPSAVSILAESVPFDLQYVEPEVVGAGFVTLQVHGARFSSETTIRLRNPESNERIDANSTSLVNAATILATFDMTGFSFGSYDLLAEDPEFAEVSLVNGVEVVQATSIESVQAELDVPSAVRGGAVGAGQVLVRNNGNIDVPVGLLSVTLPKNDNVELWADDFPDESTDEAMGEREGFALILSDLRPGEERTIPFSYMATTPFPAHGILRFKASITAYTLEDFKEGPYYHAFEQLRTALLTDPETPSDVIDLLADADEAWERAQEAFDTHFPNLPPTNTANAAWGAACALTGAIICVAVAPGYIACRVAWFVACPLLTPEIAHGEDAAGSEVVYAWDPNDKVGPTGLGDEGFVDGEAKLSYRINFENVPEAGVPAAEVKITDTLVPALDVYDFELRRINFGEITIDIPEGRSSFQTVSDQLEAHGVLVDVQASLDPIDRVATWTLRALDPNTLQLPADPFLGFLPPNDETGRGEGYVDFEIRPKSNIATGTTITNIASIVFDYNPPIITNEVSNVVDKSPPDTNVMDLPGEQPTPFVLRWAGTDEEGGSGLTTYRVYVRKNGGPAELWYEGPDEWIHFYGEVGSSYSFYSIGVDAVGNSESLPITLDAMATVTSLRRLGDFDRDGDTDALDHAALVDCLSTDAGPGEYASPDCADADFNGDRQLDLEDFGAIQRGFGDQ